MTATLTRRAHRPWADPVAAGADPYPATPAMRAIADLLHAAWDAEQIAGSLAVGDDWHAHVLRAADVERAGGQVPFFVRVASEADRATVAALLTAAGLDLASVDLGVVRAPTFAQGRRVFIEQLAFAA